MTTETAIANFLQKGVKFPLFDIDGTLLESGNKIHADSFDFALRTVYNQPTASTEEIHIHGMIDTQILIETVKLHGISEKEAKNKVNEAMKAMTYYFDKHKGSGTFIVLEGVKNILEELKKKQIPTGLLTGNVEEIGWSKMEQAGIKEYFTFGAFGNLAFKRADLIKIAQERLEKIIEKEIPLKHFVIIGDTPLDIACAKAGGIAVIAVATGAYSKDELQKAGADLVVNTLYETEEIFTFLNIN